MLQLTRRTMNTKHHMTAVISWGAAPLVVNVRYEQKNGRKQKQAIVNSIVAQNNRPIDSITFPTHAHDSVLVYMNRVPQGRSVGRSLQPTHNKRRPVAVPIRPASVKAKLRKAMKMMKIALFRSWPCSFRLLLPQSNAGKYNHAGVRS